MKITLKTLNQETFQVQVDVEVDSVKDLKERFQKECRTDIAVEKQVLIYSGKVMEDGQLLREYNINDKHFIVVMCKKGTDPAPAPAASSVKTDSATVVKEAETPAAPAADTEVKAAVTESAVVTADVGAEGETDSETSIKMITEMGYSEEEARIALQVCDNNPNRAAEYLLSEVRTTDVMPSSSSSESRNRLDFLKEQPVFNQMKKAVQENPALLPQFFEEIQKTNPELMKVISENQEEFLELINERPGEREVTVPENLTASDIEAINRLKALGYPEHLVIQAYIACNRNEFLAAEFLVSQSNDDD